jgi:hypothetical protein
MAKRNYGPKIQEEMDTVSRMLDLYCRKKHHKNKLCERCSDLENYAHKRLSFCPYGEDKGACSNCSAHCYSPEYRTKIKTVMRYTGPWMLVHHPVYSVKHLISYHRTGK